MRRTNLQSPNRPAHGVHFAAAVASWSPLIPSLWPTAMQKSRLGQETPARCGIPPL